MPLHRRWLGAILLGLTAITPIVIGGCAEHATAGVYDPYYNDYHAGNDHEVVY
jgi:hypothetical protein